MAPTKLTLFTLLLTVTLPIATLAQGTQFITGACTSDAICASGCCGFRSGKCAGPIVAQERDGGCGFGDTQPNDRAAQLLRGGGGASAPSGMTTVATTRAPVATSIAGGMVGNGSGNGTGTGNETNADIGNGNATTPAQPIAAGTQFITGACTGDGDCASSCCGFNSGKCAGPIVAQERDGGCGFGNAQPNDDAARALKGQQRRRWLRSLLGL